MENVKYIPGDLVKFNGKVRKITNIDNRPSGAVIQMGERAFVESDSLESCFASIKPVPLTPQTLEANGWKYREYYDVYEKAFDGKDYTVEEICGKWTVSDFFNTFKEDIKYCHELQHLLFGLGLDSSLKV